LSSSYAAACAGFMTKPAALRNDDWRNAGGHSGRLPAAIRRRRRLGEVPPAGFGKILDWDPDEQGGSYMPISTIPIRWSL
jgi:hypothetical protein